MRYALTLLLLLALATCDRPPDPPPDGVTVHGDEARVFSLALAQARADGGVSVRPDDPAPGVRAWLYENGFEYAYFDPDTTGRMASVLAPLNEGRPPGEAAVFGYAVYTRRPRSGEPRPL